MIRIDHILCPVDRSEISRLALDHARVLASWYDASLSVMEVVWPGMPPIAIPTLAAAEAGWPLLAPEERAEYQKTLELFCGPAPDNVIEQIEVVEGPIVDVIQKRAVKEAAQLIVMGTHGRGGFQRAVLGSTTEKVMRKAACPVLSCRRIWRRARIDRRCPTRRFSVRLISRRSRRARSRMRCRWRRRPQQRWCSRTFSNGPVRSRPPAIQVSRQVRSPSRCDAPPKSGSITAFRTRHARGVKPARSSRQESRTWKSSSSRPASMPTPIVVGVHSRPAVVAPFFGSTAHQVVRHATCPVLVVRP